MLARLVEEELVELEEERPAAMEGGMEGLEVVMKAPQISRVGVGLAV